MSVETFYLQDLGKIEIRRDIYVPHLGDTLVFNFSVGDPTYFQKQRQKIDSEGLLMPTTAQTFALIDLALTYGHEENCKAILEKFKHGFWTSTQTLYTPNEIIIYDNPDGKMPTDSASLIKRNKEGDKAVRIIPYELGTRVKNAEEFALSPIILAQSGNKNMANTIRHIASRLNYEKVYTNTFESFEKEITGHTNISPGTLFPSLWLDSTSNGRDSEKYAFGVRVIKGVQAR